MRIYGGKDYYDTIMSYGIDNTIVFNRKSNKVYLTKGMGMVEEDADLTTNKFFLYNKVYDDRRVLRKNGEYSRREVFAGAILFCGKMYPFYAEKNYDFNSKNMFSSVYYDRDELANAYPEIKDEKIWNYDYDKRMSLYTWLDTEYYNKYSDDLVTSFVIENKITTGLLIPQKKGWQVPGTSIIFVDISNLDDYHFFKIKDPYTAFSEIYSWRSGVLGSDVETIQISDKSKIQKAGFDYVKSFRNMKRD